VFKDDLAQIEYCVHGKLLPRIDYTKPRGVLRGQREELEKRKRFRQPPQKLFDMDGIRAIGGKVSVDGDFVIFDSNRYSRKGFHYKSFVMSAIVAEGVKPTLAELGKIEEAPEGIEIDVGAATSLPPGTWWRSLRGST
jgi:transcription elongation factor SPT5